MPAVAELTFLDGLVGQIDALKRVPRPDGRGPFKRDVITAHAAVQELQRKLKEGSFTTEDARRARRVYADLCMVTARIAEQVTRVVSFYPQPRYQTLRASARVAGITWRDLAEGM